MARYVCPTCGAKNKESNKYCRRCGTWLQDTIHPAKRVRYTWIGKVLKAIGWTALLLLLILILLIVIVGK